MPKSSKASKSSKPGPANEVAAFLAKCRHALLPELNALRAIVTAADARLVEGIKWNAPSFRLAGAADDCLTFNLGAKDAVRLVFHRGAAAKDAKGKARLLADDGGLLAWAADDRAIATFRSMAEVTKAKAALAEVVRAWLAAVSG